MKRIIAILLGAVLISSFTGCSKSQDTNSEVSNSSSQSKVEENSNLDISDGVTLEEVMNHEVSPEADFSFNSEEGINGYTGNERIVVVPEKIDGQPVTRVAGGFLSGNSVDDNSNVRAIKFADSITEFEGTHSWGGWGTIWGVDSLEIIVLGKGTKVLGQSTFFQLKGLREVVLNDGLETISCGAITNCDNLKSITIPESVTTIEGNAIFPLDTPKSEITIYGKADSEAEKYAKSEGFKFVAR